MRINQRWLLIFLVWLTAFAVLWWCLPVRPRLTLITETQGQIIDITGDGRYLIAASIAADEKESAVLECWDTRTGEKHRHEIPGLFNACVAAGGQAIACDCRQGQGESWIQLLSLPEGGKLVRVDQSGNPCAFSPDGRWFAVLHGISGGQYRSVAVFHASTGEKLALQNGGQPSEAASGFCISPDSRFIAIDEQVQGKARTRLCELATCRQIAVRAEDGSSWAWSHDGATLAISTRGEGLQLVETKTGKTRCQLKGPELLSAVAFAPDDRTVSAYDWFPMGGLSGPGPYSKDFNRITTWETAKGRLQHELDGRQGDTIQNPNDLEFTFLSISPGWKGTPLRLVTHGKPDANWTIVEAATGKQLGSWPHTFRAAGTSPDDTLLVTHIEPTNQAAPTGVAALWQWFKEHVLGSSAVPGEGTLQLWELAGGRLIADLGDADRHCLFSGNSKTLVTRRDSKYLDIWDVPPGKRIGAILAWSAVPVLLLLCVGALRGRCATATAATPR
jgi:WD40 repeat protein